MSKAEMAVDFFEKYNCAQAVLSAYAADFDLEKDRALQAAVGFGGGLGRHQDVCGAISGAVIALGLSSGFKEEDGRPKINEAYAKVYRFIEEFSAQYGTTKCRELLGGCDFRSEEGMQFFKDNNLKNKCRDYVRFCCELLDKYLKE